MKISVYILLCFFTITASASIDINQLRKDYVASVKSSAKTDELCEKLEAVKNPDALIMAYLGSVQAVKAKHAWNPVIKMAFLNKVFAILNKAVEKDPNHIEIRFLRYSLQYYVPAFLGYSNNLEADKDKIVQLVKNSERTQLKVPANVLNNIVKFMLESKKCNAQEQAILKKAIT